MSKQTINVGVKAGDKSGDPLRTAFTKVNENFTELYAATGADVQIPTQTGNANKYLKTDGTTLSWSTVATQIQSDWTQATTSALDFIKNKPALFSGSYTDLTSKPTIPAAAVWPVTNTAGANGPTRIAIGNSAGDIAQGNATVAVGSYAGNDTQGGAAVAIGTYAGTTTQRNDAIAIGYLTGNDVQGTGAVSIGRQAGQTNQGAYSIAIGKLAGQTNQAANTIILNALNAPLNGVSAQTNSFYVNPIRTDATPGNVLFYNTTTKEVTYGTAPAATVSSLVNGSKTVSLGTDGNLTFADAGSTFFGSGFLQSGTSGTNIGIKSWNSRQKVFVNETNVTVQTVNNSSQAYNWTFGTDGSTQFPSNTVKSAADTALAITTGESVDATQIYNRYTDFSADVTVAGGIGFISGWYQRNAQQIEFALFGPSAFVTYLTGVAVGRTMTVVYETSGGQPNQFTGTVTQAFTNQGQYDPAHPTWVRVSGRVDGTLPSNTGIRSIGFPLSNIVPHTWTFGTNGTLTFPDGYLKIVPNGANPYISNRTDNGLGLVSGSAIQIRQSVADAYGISIDSSTTDTSLGGGGLLASGSSIDVNGSKIILGQYNVNNLDANTGLRVQNKIEINNSAILIGRYVSTLTSGTTTSAFNGWTFDDGELSLPIGTVISETPSQHGLDRTKYSGTFVLDPTWFAANAGNIVNGDSFPEGILQNYDMVTGAFSFQYFGYFVPPTSANYTFRAHADETFVFWIGSKALSGYTYANKDMYGNYNGTFPEQQTQSFTIALTAGEFYPIRLQWANSGGIGQLDVFTWANDVGQANTADFTGRVFRENTGTAKISVNDNRSIILSTDNATDNNWTFAPNGALTLPNSAVIRQSTNTEVTSAFVAYTAAIASWEYTRINDYLYSINNNPNLSLAGWAFAGWNDVSGTTATAYLAIVNDARARQNSPSSPPQTLLFTPSLSAQMYIEIRALLQAVINTYATWQALLTSVEITSGSESITLLSNGKLIVPNIIQTDVEEDITIRTRYAVPASPSGTTTANKDFIFGTNGSLTFEKYAGATSGNAVIQGDSSGNLNLTGGNYVNIESWPYAAVKIARDTANTSVDMGNATSPVRAFGDLWIMSGRNITTDNTTISIVNTNATTVNFAGAATTLNMGAAGGTTTIAGNLTASQITIVNNRISTTVNDANLELMPNGVGRVVINAIEDATTSSTTRSVGYLGIPSTNSSISRTLTIADSGKHSYITSSGVTVTIPAASSVAYPVGTTLTFIAGPSSTSVSIAITTDTMYLAGTGTTGTRTLAAHGMATAVKVSGTSSAGVWYINGTGLT